MVSVHIRAARRLGIEQGKGGAVEAHTELTRCVQQLATDVLRAGIHPHQQVLRHDLLTLHWSSRAYPREPRAVRYGSHIRIPAVVPVACRVSLGLSRPRKRIART